MGYNKTSLIKSTWIHEIGHNLGLEENVGGITIKPSVDRGSGGFSDTFNYPHVGRAGVQQIIKRLDSRTHIQSKNEGVGVIRTKR